MVSFQLAIGTQPEAAGVAINNPEHGARFDQFSMLSRAAMASLGVALLPEFLIDEEVQAGRLVLAADRALETDKAYYLVLPEGKADGRTLHVRCNEPMQEPLPSFKVDSDGLSRVN